MTTLEKLQSKMADSSIRMPSLQSISELLTSFGISHEFKFGTKLIIKGESPICIDTLSPSYSYNTQFYASRLVDLFSNKII